MVIMARAMLQVCMYIHTAKQYGVGDLAVLWSIWPCAAAVAPLHLDLYGLSADVAI